MDPEEKQQIFLRLGVKTRGARSTEEVLILPATQNTLLSNRMQFVTICVEGVWKTFLVTTPEDRTGGVEPGDQILSYFSTGEMFDTRMKLTRVLRLEKDKGGAFFDVVINRDGRQLMRKIHF